MVRHRILVSDHANLNPLAYAVSAHHHSQPSTCPAGEQGLRAPCAPNLGGYALSEHPSGFGIYLLGEAAAKEEHDDSAGDDDKEGELAGVISGAKREAGSWPRGGRPRKIAKTTAQGGRSTADMGTIGDRHPDLTLIDASVGEDTPTHTYGRHGCLYIKMKVAANKKPNPHEAVSFLFHGVPCY